MIRARINRKVAVIVGILAIATVAVVLVLVFWVIRKPEVENLVDYYEKLITSEALRAQTYEPPLDARIYQADNDTPIDFGTYDFVIIGAGSTGSLIANRLSEIDQWRVLLIEAGQLPSEATEVPALYAFGVFSDYNWGYRSVPQTTACLGAENEQCLVPTGRGVGGSTLINGLIYSRGPPADYDKWAELVGDPSWSYDNILEYFKKTEDFHQTDPDAPVDWEYHSTGGELYVEHHNPRLPLTDIFLEANEELGYNVTDYNSPDQIGGSIVQYNTKGGRRLDQGTAFILSVSNRSNLEVLTDSYVTRIEINNYTKEATGVIFTQQGKTYRVAADKEVILSAGAISSPKLLMLSGIGPKDHLYDVGIPVIEDLPVGSVLREHVSPYGLHFSSNMSRLNQTLREQVEDYLNGFGALTSNTQSHVFGFYKSGVEEASNSPDLEIVVDLADAGTEFGKRFLNWKYETWDALFNNENISFSMVLVLLHSQSVGSVKLNSSSPFDYPLIDYNLLSDPNDTDINALYEGIQLCLELVNTTAFKKVGARFESRPLPACGQFEYLSKDYWYCYMRQTTLAVYHPVGSCPSGTDPLAGAVVDSELQVFGVQKLRVADSSVFPLTLASHPSAACTMIGEKISDVIKSRYSASLNTTADLSG